MRSLLHRIGANFGRVVGVIVGVGVIVAFSVTLGSTSFAKHEEVTALEHKMELRDKMLEDKCTALERGIDTMRVDVKYMKEGIDELRKGVTVLLYRDNTRTR